MSENISSLGNLLDDEDSNITFKLSPCSACSRSPVDKNAFEANSTLKERRAQSAFNAATRFYFDGDTEQCISLLDKSIQMSSTVEARQLRAAVIEARDSGVKLSQLGNDVILVPKQITNSPPVVLRKTFSMRNRRQTFPEANSRNMKYPETKLKDHGTEETEKVSESLPLFQPPKLRKTKSLIPRLRTSWPSRDSPIEYESRHVDRKRLRRSNEGILSFPSSFLETIEKGNKSEEDGLTLCGSETSSLQSDDLELESVGSSSFRSSLGNPPLGSSGSFRLGSSGSFRLRSNGSFKQVHSHSNEGNKSKPPPNNNRVKTELINEPNFASPNPNQMECSPYVKSLSYEDENFSYSLTCQTLSKSENYQYGIGSARKELPPLSSSLTFATPTREQLFNSSCDIDVSKQVQACISKNLKLIAIDFDHTLISIHTHGKWSRTAGELSKYIRPLFRSLVPALLKAGIVVAIVTFSPQVKIIERVLNLAFPPAQLEKNMFVCGARGEWDSPTTSIDNVATSRYKPPRTSLYKWNEKKGLSKGSSSDAFFDMHKKKKFSPPYLDIPPRRMSTSPLTLPPASSHSAWSPTREGKCRHIETILRRYSRAFPNVQGPKSGEILLIDDDKNNVEVSRAKGINTLWFRATMGDITCEKVLLEDLISFQPSCSVTK